MVDARDYGLCHIQENNSIYELSFKGEQLRMTLGERKHICAVKIEF